MPSFMFLFWAPKHLLAGPPRSPEQARESGEKWRAWEESLRKAGHEPTGAQLEATGQCLTGPDMRITEGTFAGEHVLGGHFIVKAADLAQATELAKGCPMLRFGGTVEVRPLVDH